MKKDRQRKVQEKLVGIIFILTLFLFLIINVIVMKNLKLIWMISLLEETCGES